MLRWYDYILAIMVANVMTTNVLVILTEDQSRFWMDFFNGVVIMFMWEVWNGYCEWRLKNDES